MIHFPRLLTPRLNVQLRELTIREAVELNATPLGQHELAVSAMLAAVVKEAAGPHNNPGRWTVQERTLAVAHYLSGVSEDGGNFAIGEGRFLDYLDVEADRYVESFEAGEAGGNAWQVGQLTGDAAVIMESICSRRMDWITADMAARLVPMGSGEAPAPDATDEPHRYREWLTVQKSLIEALPESDFAALFAIYKAGLRGLHHLFSLDFDREGHLVLPHGAAQRGKEGGATLAPARFPVSACFTELAGYLGA